VVPTEVQLHWRILRAGSFRLDGGSMFGVVPRVLWSKLVAPDEKNRIPLQTNCVLIERKGLGGQGTEGQREQWGPGLKRSHYILIETGYGEKWSDKERDIFALEKRSVVDALREVNVAPEQVDLVIVTHLHFDHAAGLTRYSQNSEAGVPPVIVPTFPNAKIVVQRTEWEDALSNKSTMTRTYLRSHLDPVSRQIELVDGEATIVPEIGLRVMPMIGHTWGQQAVLWEDEAGTLCFPGDVIPTINHAGLAYSLGYDMLPYENMLNKKALLERALGENWRLVLDHEPGDPVVRPVREADGKFVLQVA
jgi:glyoxylase-like metal-dependent hydrolase (beta-lactamase superfamily II)